VGQSKRGRVKKDYYYGDNAEEYATSRWMAKNQINTSIRCYELLFSKELGGMVKEDPQDLLILDMGCGNGFSTLIFEDEGFNVIGIDISFDMLLQNIQQQRFFHSKKLASKSNQLQNNIENKSSNCNNVATDSNITKPTQSDEDNMNIDYIPRILINAPIEFIPLRNKVIDHAISISAFNFIIDERNSIEEKKKIISKVKNDLFKILKNNGRVVIEFYPKKKDINLYLKGFSGKFTGGMIIDNPNTKKEKKFLILKKQD